MSNGNGSSQLAKLATKFPDKLVKKAPQGKYGSYVEHGTITQALLATCGPFSQTVSQVIRGYVPQAERKDRKTGEIKVLPELPDAIVGVVLALSLVIDGREVVVEEVGDVDDPHNWTHDGARLKDAISDAIKRCAMRLGLGLHLWCQEDYFLDASLTRKSEAASA